MTVYISPDEEDVILAKLRQFVDTKPGDARRPIAWETRLPGPVTEEFRARARQILEAGGYDLHFQVYLIAQIKPQAKIA